MRPGPRATTDPEALTVADALTLDALRDARLAAGRDGLERRVLAVGVLDPTDTGGVQRGELLVSNAYALRDVDLPALVARLAETGASALGINLDAVWTELPADLCEAADRAGLPLLLLRGGRFGDLIDPLRAVIAERAADVLRRASALRDRLTQVAFAEERLDAVARELTATLGLACAVYDADGRAIASAGDVAGWSSPELVAAARTVTDVGAIRAGGRPHLVAPVTAMERRVGAVCLRGARPGDEAALTAVRDFAVATGMVLVLRRKVEAVYRKFEAELVEDLLDRRLTEHEARERIARTGWAGRPWVVALAGRRPPLVGLRGAEDLALAGPAREALARAAGRAAPAGSVVFHRGPCVGVLVPLASAEADLVALGERILDGLARAAEPPGGLAGIALGMSRADEDLVALPALHRQAWIALMMSPEIVSGRGRLDRFDALGAYRLVAAIEDPALLERTALDALGALGDASLTGRPDLLDTLTALLAHNMRLPEAAAELYVHYGTVRHRLARLRELLGERLDEPDGRMALWLGVCAMRVLAADRTLAGAGARGED
ncbi:MAG TPA: PucR family transcriptional regulator [Conexibacter sp.]|nr:PucR family transcriptional regulator [Conexibacter sp.]